MVYILTYIHHMSRPTTVQSVIIPRDKFSLAQAKAWIVENDYKTSFRGKGVDIKPNFWRFRQTPPSFKDYRTKRIGHGIMLILGVH